MPDTVKPSAFRTALQSLLVLIAGAPLWSYAATPPSALSYPSPDTFYVGSLMTPLQPTVSGTVTAYSSVPALPPGLVLDSTSGMVTGTPTKATARTDYTITAKNTAGSTTFPVSISIDTPSVDVISSDISRMLVAGTTISVVAEIAPVGFTFTGTLYAMASDPNHVFASAVTVKRLTGTYEFQLSTSPALAAGHYQGDLLVKLCTNAACSGLQPVNSVTVPYQVDAMSAASAWLGDHVTPLSAWTGVADWSMFQGNAAHTGFVRVTLDPDTFTSRWTKPVTTVPGQNGLLVASLATAQNQLFVSGSNHLYALKELDGSANWSYDFSGLPYPSVNPASIAKGIVYVAAGQQSSTYLFAFNAKTGALRFKSGMSSQWENYLSPTIGPQGIYTNSGTYGGLYGFAPSGTQLFVASELQTSLWTPAVDASGVYTYTGYLQVTDPVTGAVTHTITDHSFQNYTYIIGGSPVIGTPGSIFMANYENSLLNGGGIGNTLINFRVANNSIAWQVPGDYPSTPAYGNGRLYACNNNPMRLEVRAEADGTLLWSWVPPQAGDVAFISEVLLTKNVVFVSTNLATYAIDLKTHKPVWSVPLVGKLALSKNGILYIQAANKISAFNVK